MHDTAPRFLPRMTDARIRFVAQPSLHHLRRRDEAVRLGRALVANVHHRHAQRRQHVGDEPAMTAPPEDLGAHDGGAKTVRQHQQFEQPVGELLRRDVLGVGAKRRMPPGEVR